MQNQSNIQRSSSAMEGVGTPSGHTDREQTPSSAAANVPTPDIRCSALLGSVFEFLINDPSVLLISHSYDPKKDDNQICLETHLNIQLPLWVCNKISKRMDQTAKGVNVGSDPASSSSDISEIKSE